MRARRILLWSGLAFLGLLIAAGIGLWNADLGTFKPQLERWVSDKTGRSFVVSGRFSVNLGSQTVIVAEGIRFGNPDWADEPDMLEIGHLELRLDTWSFLKGPIEVEFVGLDDARVHLVRRAVGEPNWSLPLPKSPTPAKPKSVGPAFLIREVDVNGVRLTYESPLRTGPLDLTVIELHQSHRADDTLELAVAATLNEREVTLQGIAGTWDALLKHKNINYELEGQFDTLSITSKGFIDDLADLHRPTMHFSIRSPDINDVARLLQLPAGGVGDIDLNGSLVAASDDSPLQLDVKGKLGQSRIDAAGTISGLQDIENIGLRLRASGPDLNRIMRLFGVRDIPDAPFDLELDLERQGALLTVERAHLLFAEADFSLQGRLPEFPGLNNGAAHLRVTGPDFEHFRRIMGLPGNAIGEFALDFDLDVSPDGIDVVQLQIETSLAKVEAQGRLGKAPDYVGTDVQFKVQATLQAELASAYGLARMSDTPFSLAGAATVAAEGIRTREPVAIEFNDVKASINGLIAMKAGLVGSDLAFELSGPSLAELVDSFAAADMIPAKSFDLHGELQIQSKGYRFRDGGGTLGRSDLTFSGLLQPAGGLAGSDLNFAVSGPALEELLEHIDHFRLQPGAFSLSGKGAIKTDTFELQTVELERPRGKIKLDLVLGRLETQPRVKFDVEANGADFRSMLGQVSGIEFYEAPFSISSSGVLGSAHLSLDKLNVLIGDMTIVAQGDLDFEGNSSSTAFELSARVPSLAKIGTHDGSRFHDQRLELDGTVHSGGKTIAVEGLRAMLGDSEVRGFVRFTNTDIPELEIDLKSASIVLSPWLEEAELTVTPAPEKTDGRVIPDLAIPFDLMQTLNAAVKLDIGELRRENLVFRNIAMHAELREGALHLHSVRLQGLSGWLQARAVVEAMDGLGKTTLEIAAREVAIGTPGSNDGFSGIANLDVNLETSGADLRALAGNANGVVILDIYDGQSANKEFLNIIFGDVLNEIVSTINPFSKTESVTKFDCAIFPLDINNGLLLSTPSSFIRTDKIQVVSALSLNLKNEQISANVRTNPRKGVSISAGQILNPFIKVVGTLAAPRLAVDEQGVLVTGGVAVATGGLSLLAKAAWDRLSRSADPCDDVREEVLKVFSGRLSELSDANLQ